MDRDDYTYETAADRAQAIRDAEAISRRDESRANILRGRAMRDPRGEGAFRSAVSEAVKQEMASTKEAEKAGEGTARADLSGTAPTLSDSEGNFAPNPEVANTGGTGVEASNTNAETDEQAEKPDEVDTSAADGTIAIPDNWKSLPWPERRSLASSLTDDPIRNGEDADAAIEAELQRRRG